MSIQVLPPARAELVDAANYYERQQIGLGWRLWEEVDQYIQWIAQNPTVPRLRAGHYHRVNLRHFPYYVAYIVRRDVIWILAIASAKRLPEYWITRLKEME